MYVLDTTYIHTYVVLYTYHTHCILLIRHTNAMNFPSEIFVYETVIEVFITELKAAVTSKGNYGTIERFWRVQTKLKERTEWPAALLFSCHHDVQMYKCTVCTVCIRSSGTFSTFYPVPLAVRAFADLTCCRVLKHCNMHIVVCWCPPLTRTPSYFSHTIQTYCIICFIHL